METIFLPFLLRKKSLSGRLRIMLGQANKAILPFALLISLNCFFPSPNLWAGAPALEVCFTPGESCTEKIVKALSQSRTSVLVQAYSFTSAPIARALVDAHKRGVHVEMILDRSNKSQKYSSADFVSRAGIPTFIDSRHAIAHNKIMIIDGETVVTGSFNFTKAAEEKNAENLLVIPDKSLASRYTANWQVHKRHSEVYSGR